MCFLATRKLASGKRLSGCLFLDHEPVTWGLKLTKEQQNLAKGNANPSVHIPKVRGWKWTLNTWQKSGIQRFDGFSETLHQYTRHLRQAFYPFRHSSCQFLDIHTYTDFSRNFTVYFKELVFLEMLPLLPAPLHNDSIVCPTVDGPCWVLVGSSLRRQRTTQRGARQDG